MIFITQNCIPLLKFTVLSFEYYFLLLTEIEPMSVLAMPFPRTQSHNSFKQTSLLPLMPRRVLMNIFYLCFAIKMILIVFVLMIQMLLKSKFMEIKAKIRTRFNVLIAYFEGKGVIGIFIFCFKSDIYSAIIGQLFVVRVCRDTCYYFGLVRLILIDDSFVLNSSFKVLFIGLCYKYEWTFLIFVLYQPQFGLFLSFIKEIINRHATHLSTLIVFFLLGFLFRHDIQRFINALGIQISHYK